MGSACTIFCFSMLRSNCSCSASLISFEVTEPKSLPLLPAFAAIFTWIAPSFLAFSSASAFSRAICAALAFSLRRKALRLSAVASVASLRGRR